jgi:REP element-mobilizing transposase RayT
MTRPDRIQAPGFHHVFSRGTAGLTFFVDDEDKRFFLQLLGQAANRLEWSVHAYCLMTTHYHAIIETRDANLSRGMQLVNSKYVRAYNDRWSRFGTLVSGRFGSRTIDSEEYFYEACRYVFLNPVRAELCRRASEWPWSGGLRSPATADL